MILISDFLVGYIPVEMEKKLFADMTLSQIGKKTEKRANAEVYLNKLLKKISLNDDHGVDYSISLSEMEVPNAFALPGGHIVITKGLLAKIDTENGLAMVIAHEIAHQRYRHPIRSMGRAVVIGLALSSILGMESSSLATYLTTGVNFTLLSFSRDQEREADSLGKELLEKTYGHAMGASEFFRNIGNPGSSSLPDFFATHPMPEKRIEYLESGAAGGETTELDQSIIEYLKSVTE